jgi:hypothetical protein
MRNLSVAIWRTLVMATFAVWFGGFMFYVSFVVPIGTDVLGSARAQGFVTRLVAHKLNLMCGIAVGVMLMESLRSWRSGGRVWRYVALLMVGLIGALLIGLIVLHPELDRMLDFDTRRVMDRQKFYSLHRIYLWFSTFQWIFACFWLFGTIRNWTNQNLDRSAPDWAGAS